MTPAELVFLSFLALNPAVGPSCTFAAPQGATVLAKQMFTCKARVSGRQHGGSLATNNDLVEVWRRGKNGQPDRYVGEMPCARRIAL